MVVTSTIFMLMAEEERNSNVHAKRKVTFRMGEKETVMYFVLIKKKH